MSIYAHTCTHHSAKLSCMWSLYRSEAFMSLCEQMIIQHSLSKQMILSKIFFFHAAYSVKLMKHSQGPCGLGMSKQQRVGESSHPGHFSGSVQFSSIQFLSHVRLLTPWTASQQASLSITNSWSLLKHMSIKLVMPSNHLILSHPLLLLPSIFPSIRVFSNELVLQIRWPKDWSFSFSISPSNEHSGLISFRMDWLDLLAVQGTLKSLL